MKIDIYWKRFLEKLVDSFDCKYTRAFYGEFEKDNKKFRVYLQIQEVTDQKIKKPTGLKRLICNWGKSQGLR